MEYKHVTSTAKMIISGYNIGLFVIVWLQYYNQYAFQKFYREGAVISILLYVLIYGALCRLYKGFRIASYSVIETGLSQLIAIGMADLLLYIECCLTSNHYINILPGFITYFIQACGTFLIIFLVKRFFINHVPPKKTLLIYGRSISKEEIEEYQARLLIKYRHLFEIAKVVQETDILDYHTVLGTAKDYHTVMLYETEKTYRGKIMRHCLNAGQSIYFTPYIEDILVSSSETKHLLDTPLLKYNDVQQNNFYFIIKRVCDVLLSLLILIITFPVFIVTAAAIKLEDHGPVFFQQMRCTLHENQFRIYKFRSMVIDSEKNGFKPCTANDSRITRTGKIIRKLRIDELPQLLNVLKGEMSLIGPRPERIEHVAQYTDNLPEFALRARVKAGITGYAQIYGKYNTSAYDKLRLDLMYIENQSLMLDLKLLLLTFKVIFVPESSEGFTEKRSKEIVKGQKTVLKDELAVTQEEESYYHG